MISFRAQLALRIGLMMVLLSALGAGAIWSLSAANRDYSLAMDGYNNLREIYAIGEVVQSVRQKLKWINSTEATLEAITVEPESAEANAIERVRKALIRKNASEASQLAEKAAGMLNVYKPMASFGGELEDLRKDAAFQMEMLNGPLSFVASGLEDDLGDLDDLANQALVDMGDMTARVRRKIEEHETSAEESYRMIYREFVVFLVVVAVGSLWIGINQYKTVMRPLNRLGAGVRGLSKGAFHEHVDESGPLEFAMLAMNFNAMADQIQTLCANLENDVEVKSRELAQSERLALVGRLAAGVAHEINNPMGIIAGHAELALREMDKGSEPEAIAEAKNALTVIAQEAFRCKEIVNRLLSMSRGGDGARTMVSLTKIAADVAGTVRGLIQEKACRVCFDATDEPMEISGIEGEIRQVVLNLVVNAVEATREMQDMQGDVILNLTRDSGFIELSVLDNGKGMAQEVIERVFEPFFTEKRGAGSPGTGLGLSISHAIVKRHGGTITAQSEGVGRGSRFVVRFPRVEQNT